MSNFDDKKFKGLDAFLKQNNPEAPSSKEGEALQIFAAIKNESEKKAPLNGKGKILSFLKPKVLVPVAAAAVFLVTFMVFQSFSPLGSSNDEALERYLAEVADIIEANDEMEEDELFLNESDWIAISNPN